MNCYCKLLPASYCHFLLSSPSLPVRVVAISFHSILMSLQLISGRRLITAINSRTRHTEAGLVPRRDRTEAGRVGGMQDEARWEADSGWGLTEVRPIVAHNYHRQSLRKSDFPEKYYNGRNEQSVVLRARVNGENITWHKRRHVTNWTLSTRTRQATSYMSGSDGGGGGVEGWGGISHAILRVHWLTSSRGHQAPPACFRSLYKTR